MVRSVSLQHSTVAEVFRQLVANSVKNLHRRMRISDASARLISCQQHEHDVGQAVDNCPRSLAFAGRPCKLPFMTQHLSVEKEDNVIRTHTKAWQRQRSPAGRIPKLRITTPYTSRSLRASEPLYRLSFADPAFQPFAAHVAAAISLLPLHRPPGITELL